MRANSATEIPVGPREYDLPLPAAELMGLPEQPAAELPVADGLLQHLRLLLGSGALQQAGPAITFPVMVDAQPHGDRGQERPEPIGVQIAVGRRSQQGLLDAVLGVMEVGQPAAHQADKALTMLDHLTPGRIAR